MTEDTNQHRQGGSSRSRALVTGLLVTIGLTVAVAGLAPSAAAQTDDSQTKTYVGGGAYTWHVVPDDPLLLVSDDCCHCATDTFLFGAAFCNEAEHSQVSISIDDAVFEETAAYVEVYSDSSEDPIHSGSFCSSTTIDTAQANEVNVFLGDPVNLNLDCPNQGTTGTVTVTWS